MSSEIETRATLWLKGPFDEETKREVKRLLSHDPTSLRDAFYRDLSFGTGGMRGVMGVGTNRVNVYTIRKATLGLARYLLKQPEPIQGRRVFIGFDTRHNSSLFASETARVLAACGIRVHLSCDPCPTPLTSFGCRHFGCLAAVMITASHNPPQYNGYKVYWEGGAQVVFPHDEGIMEEVRQVDLNRAIPLASADDPLIERVDRSLDPLFLAALRPYQACPETKTSLSVVYSNLHGTGIRLLPDALKDWGISCVSLVASQMTADGSFPTAPSPNPEEEKALKLGITQLLSEKGDLLLATDPDADRVGAVVLHQGEAVRLTGHQIGALLLDHLLFHLSQRRELPQSAAAVKTIVTTELFRKIAESYGVSCLDVLTGFKYIAEQIDHWEKKPDSPHFLLGAEESYGYLIGPYVRDKDAIGAGCLLAEAAAVAKQEGATLVDRLHNLYRRFGVHREALHNLSFSDSPEGLASMQAITARLRQEPPQAIAGIPIVTSEDYLARLSRVGKQVQPLLLPKSDVLRYFLEDGTKVVIRPSGTEPKMKLYLEGVEPIRAHLESTIEAVDLRLEEIAQTLRSEWNL